MKTILIFMLFVSSLLAEEPLNDLIKKLGNDDFDIRVEATNKLGEYPAEFSKKFIEISTTSDDPEIKARLEQAARLIFKKKIINQYDEWLLMHGSFCIDGHEVHQLKPQDKNKDEELQKPEQHYGYNETISIGIFVNWVYEGGSSDGKITRWDIIEEVEGLNINQVIYYQKSIKVGQEYKLKLRRYKEADEILKDGYVNPEIKYETITLTLKAGYKNADPAEEQKLIDRLWLKYIAK
jgi:hypothetical protein